MCVILDVRMRGLSGLGLQKRLVQQGVRIPIIFLTGFGDVTSAVQAIRSGGFDFLEKPLHRELLLERIFRALDLDAQLLMQERENATIEKRIDTLSRRERDVYSLLVEGNSNKEIARTLAIGMPTVTKHRTRVLHKMGARNVFELVALAAKFHPSEKYTDMLASEHLTGGISNNLKHGYHILENKREKLPSPAGHLTPPAEAPRKV
jgi:FixJ family two-component response regulator